MSSLQEQKIIKKTFFPYCINEWALTLKLGRLNQIKFLKRWLQLKIRNIYFFSVYDPYGVTILTNLRLQFSYLQEHKFRHVFGDTVSPILIYFLHQIILTPLGKCKWKVLCTVVTASFLSPICTPIIKMIWLNYCKIFLMNLLCDTEDIRCVWFRCLVCMNYFQLLCVLIILGI